MLLQFSIKNYKTFKDIATLSLIASNYDKLNLENNTFLNRKFNYRLLKSAVLYGANASGKSKFFEAYHAFRNIVFNSSRESLANERIEVTPFLLDSKSEKEPTSFEIVFINGTIQFRYGFEANKEKVNREWLYSKTSTKEIELFYRVNQKITSHSEIDIANDLIEKNMIRENALLLSVLAQFNDKTARKIFNSLRNINSISGIRQEGYEGYTIHQLDNEKNVKKQEIIDFLNVADFGIEDLKVNKLDVTNLPEDMPEPFKEMIRKSDSKNKLIYEDVTAFRRKFRNGKPTKSIVAFSMDEDESSGTIKYFALSGPILDTLKSGATLFVDELDSQLHPSLIKHLIKLFNSKEFNPKNAQLVFNTHESNLLSTGVFRRDQIWFTEKDHFGCAHIFS
ncbi:MAG: ATP-binding protein, partial [Bacteroidota bacterium]